MAEDIAAWLREADAEWLNHPKILQAAREIEALRAEVERLRAALKTVGDDYPGSSCQQWCYEQAGLTLPSPGDGK